MNVRDAFHFVSPGKYAHLSWLSLLPRRLTPPRRRLLLFKRRLTGKDGAFCLCGPCKHKGGYTSESNKAFDQSLKSQAPHMGIRDIEALSELAEAVGLQLRDDFAMPANNELLVFVRGICEP